MIPLIISGSIPREKVPYSFLLIEEHSLGYNLLVTAAIYLIGYLLASFLSWLNRRLSWVWFKDIIVKNGKYEKTN